MSTMNRPRFGDGFGGDDETPSVAIPSKPWVLPLGIAAAVSLGGVVFWQLSSSRTQVEPAPIEQPVTYQPPAVDFVALAAAEQPSETVTEAVAPPPPQPPSPDLDSRLRSPALVVDLSQAAAPQAANAVGSPLAPGSVSQALSPRGATQSADEQFATRLGVDENSAPARAHRMQNQGFIIAQGAVIPAVLETAINSDLPGYVRAVVSRDVSSFDGRNVLVPRGSRLVGQYRSGVALGQSRAFVIWTRLIRPDGIGVDLAAPGTDSLGRGGLEGRVDRHFLQRFGGAILLSLITAGAQLAGNDADTQVIIASTTGAAGTAASVALQSDLDIAPTVEVAQGEPIRVFVTRDLDFTVVNEQP